MLKWSIQRALVSGLAAGLVIAVWSWPLARAEDNDRDDNSAAQPSEPSLRFTPIMARGLGAIYVREMLSNRYDLPEDKRAEAEEKIARRLMQFAHKIEGPGCELIERFVEEQLARAGRDEAGTFIPRGFGKEFADRLLPLLPEVRELARGVAQDIRPMLPMKKQFQMAGEMMAFKTFMDGFEETMEKWSSGEITECEDPFRESHMQARNEQGETPNLEWARRSAQNMIDRPRARLWKAYLDEFKTLYELDAAQVATAESILREYTDREKTITSKPEWSQRVYQDQLWLNVSYQMPASWLNPAGVLLKDDLEAAKAPIDQLEEEFKTRLETIPTRAQRLAAEDKVAGLLKDKGLDVPATQPQSATEPKP